MALERSHEQLNDLRYSVVFHFNPFMKQWNCIPRDSYTQYWNGKNSEKIGRGPDIDDAFADYIIKNLNDNT